MKIGDITLSNPLVLAPLAGISHLPFRLLAKRAGCGLVCSEMISAKGLVYGNAKTERLLASDPEEKPLSVQIFGADPIAMAEAARMVQDSGADIVDINFGCSVKKVIKTGAGAALMKNPALAKRVLASVRQAVRIPVTIKIRSGWTHTGAQALELVRIAEKCGIDAVAVHPRSARQGFGGKADWNLITEIKRQVGIPIIGNGDVRSEADALEMMKQTGCDAIMVGRAAIGNPWVLSAIAAHFADRQVAWPGHSERIEVMESYARLMVRHFGEAAGCRMLRSQLGWFSKSLPGSARFRESIKRMTSLDEVLSHIEKFENDLKTAP